MWCPTRGVSIWPSETRHAQHEKCGWLKGGPQGARYARIAAGDLRRCPPPFSQPLCSAMSSMHRCCSSELKRRTESLLRITLNRTRGAWDSAINVGINDSDDLLRYKLVYDYRNPLIGQLKQAAQGFKNLTGTEDLPALDFLPAKLLNKPGAGGN